jgi:hypothetical protein
MICQIFGDFHASIAPQFVESYVLIVLAILAGLIMHFLPTRLNSVAISTYSSLPSVAQGIILAVVIFFVIQARSSDLVPFIYLQY